MLTDMKFASYAIIIETAFLWNEGENNVEIHD